MRSKVIITLGCLLVIALSGCSPDLRDHSDEILKASSGYSSAWSSIMRSATTNLIGRYTKSVLKMGKRQLIIMFTPDSRYYSRVKSWSYQKRMQQLGSICPGNHENLHKLQVKYDFDIYIHSVSKDGEVLNQWECDR